MSFKGLVPVIILMFSLEAGTGAPECDPHLLERANELCSKQCTKEQCQAQAEQLLNNEDIIKISEEAARVEMAKSFNEVLRPQVDTALAELKEFKNLPGISEAGTIPILIDAVARPTEFKKHSSLHVCFGKWIRKAADDQVKKLTDSDCPGAEGYTLQEVQHTLEQFVASFPKLPKEPVTLKSGPPHIPREIRDAKNVDRYLTLTKNYLKKRNLTAVEISEVMNKLERVIASLRALSTTGIAIWKKTDETGTGNYIFRPLAGQSTRLDVWVLAKGLTCLTPKGSEQELPKTLARLKTLAGMGRLNVSCADDQRSPTRLPASTGGEK